MLVDISAFSFLFKTFLGCYGRKRLPNGIPFLRFEPKSQIFRVREANSASLTFSTAESLVLGIAMTSMFILNFKMI